MSKIRVAINGYGNLGKGTELAVCQSPDMEVVAVFTRRDPREIKTLGAPAVPLEDMAQWRDKVDVCANCGGSATDLDVQTPAALKYFHTVDTFDTHPKIPSYFAKVDQAAREHNHLGLISVGWDPGFFSLLRAYTQAFLPAGSTTTFWGRGVSQGHSDALRRIEGVAGAVQYTVPIDSALVAARAGQAASLSTREKHLRQCYVVLDAGADADRVREQIVSMPDYFADYDTSVTFISAEELASEHSTMPHGGSVIRHGKTSPQAAHAIELSMQLDSNPEFTGSVVAASLRAASRLAAQGQVGAISLFDVAPRYLLAEDPAVLRAEIL